jgi:hypothetical protein
MTMPIQWTGEKPKDADDWERIIREQANRIEGTGGAVRIRTVPEGWLIEAARKMPPFDFRWHITEELKKAGKRVIGVDMLQDGPSLSPEREAAIRAAQGQPWEVPVGFDRMHYDAQIVADLLAEVDRLRSKLQLAAQARDLTGQAASNLRDACEDITPRAVQGRRGPSK